MCEGHGSSADGNRWIPKVLMQTEDKKTRNHRVYKKWHNNGILKVALALPHLLPVHQII